MALPWDPRRYHLPWKVPMGGEGREEIPRPMMGLGEMLIQGPWAYGRVRGALAAWGGGC